MKAFLLNLLRSLHMHLSLNQQLVIHPLLAQQQRTHWLVTVKQAVVSVETLIHEREREQYQHMDLDSLQRDPGGVHFMCIHVVVKLMHVDVLACFLFLFTSSQHSSVLKSSRYVWLAKSISHKYKSR